jgi:hypothetical protein
MLINPGIWDAPAWEFPMLNVQLLRQLLNEFPITDQQDLDLLNGNETRYHRWLDTCTEEGSSQLPYVPGNRPYNRLLERVSAWIRILTHGATAAEIKESKYLDVYVDFAQDTPAGGYAGDFFLNLCFQHMKMAAWMFTEDNVTRVIGNTQRFFNTVHEVLQRMERDYAPTRSQLDQQLHPLDFDHVQKYLSNVLVHTWNLWAQGEAQEALRGVSACIRQFVSFMHPSKIVWAWNTAVYLMIEDFSEEDTTRIRLLKKIRSDAFIEQLRSDTRTYMGWDPVTP